MIKFWFWFTRPNTSERYRNLILASPIIGAGYVRPEDGRRLERYRKGVVTVRSTEIK